MQLFAEINAGIISCVFCSTSGLKNWDIDAVATEYEAVLQGIAGSEVKELGLG